MFNFLLVILITLSSEGQPIRKYKQGEILVKVSTPFTQKKLTDGLVETEQEWFNQFSKKFEVRELRPIFHEKQNGLENFFILKFSAKKSVEDVIIELKKEQNVNDAWINRISVFFSDDPLYEQQWGVAKIQASQAWEIYSGSSNVLLAILDSGIDLGDPNFGVLTPHPDLQSNLWNNNFMFGLDLSTNPPSPPNDLIGHGTMVAGIAGAITNNQIGIAGVAGGGTSGNLGIKILALKYGPNPPDDAQLSQKL